MKKKILGTTTIPKAFLVNVDEHFSVVIRWKEECKKSITSNTNKSEKEESLLDFKSTKEFQGSNELVKYSFWGTEQKLRKIHLKCFIRPYTKTQSLEKAYLQQ